MRGAQKGECTLREVAPGQRLEIGNGTIPWGQGCDLIWGFGPTAIKASAWVPPGTQLKVVGGELGSNPLGKEMPQLKVGDLVTASSKGGNTRWDASGRFQTLRIGKANYDLWNFQDLLFEVVSLPSRWIRLKEFLRVQATKWIPWLLFLFFVIPIEILITTG